MGGRISVQLSVDDSSDIANKTGFSVAQINKLYHRYDWVTSSNNTASSVSYGLMGAQFGNWIIGLIRGAYGLIRVYYWAIRIGTFAPTGGQLNLAD